MMSFGFSFRSMLIEDIIEDKGSLWKFGVFKDGDSEAALLGVLLV